MGRRGGKKGRRRKVGFSNLLWFVLFLMGGAFFCKLFLVFITNRHTIIIFQKSKSQTDIFDSLNQKGG